MESAINTLVIRHFTATLLTLHYRLHRHSSYQQQTYVLEPLLPLPSLSAYTEIQLVSEAGIYLGWAGREIILPVQS